MMDILPLITMMWSIVIMVFMAAYFTIEVNHLHEIIEVQQVMLCDQMPEHELCKEHEKS